MLTKNFTQHLPKDVLNPKGESSTSTAQDYNAERFIRSAKIMRLRECSTLLETLNLFFKRGQSPIRKSVSARALFRPAQIAFEVEARRLARRTSLISDTILCFSDIASGLLPLE
jgi:hypothetical protein